MYAIRSYYVTTLTKRLAEELTDYLARKNIKARYLHSDIDTIERTEIIRNLRLGKFDCLVGINLLREGLDIPEVGFVGILDARITSYNVCYTKLLRFAEFKRKKLLPKKVKNFARSLPNQPDGVTKSPSLALRRFSRTLTYDMYAFAPEKPPSSYNFV